jgi:hypothetical protein
MNGMGFSRETVLIVSFWVALPNFVLVCGSVSALVKRLRV